ncbi:glycosyltransferase [Flavobacteriaceae bacterium]|nr:glycosyltransferase [Flavobacteriaceae bacterium]
MIKVLHVNPHFQLLDTYNRGILKAKGKNDVIQFDYLVYDETFDSFPKTINGSVFKMINPFKSVRLFAKNLKDVLKENNYDIVHLHLNFLNSLAILAIKFFNIKVKIVSHHHINKKTTSLKSKLFRFSTKIIINIFSDIKLSDSTRAGAEVYWGDYIVLRPLIDYNKFLFNSQKRDEARKYLGVDSGTTIIGNVSNFIYGKNQLFLLKILKILNERHNKKYKLVLYGQDYGTLSKIKQEINRLCINDEVLIESDYPVKDIYNAFDIFVFPSLFEGFGIVSLEAQVNGLQMLINENLTSESFISKSNTFQLSVDHHDEWVNLIEKIKLDNRVSKYEVSKKFDIAKSSFLFDLYKKML